MDCTVYVSWYVDLYVDCTAHIMSGIVAADRPYAPYNIWNMGNTWNPGSRRGGSRTRGFPVNKRTKNLMHKKTICFSRFSWSRPAPLGGPYHWGGDPGTWDRDHISRFFLRSDWKFANVSFFAHSKRMFANVSNFWPVESNVCEFIMRFSFRNRKFVIWSSLLASRVKHLRKYPSFEASLGP